MGRDMVGKEFTERERPSPPLPKEVKLKSIRATEVRTRRKGVGGEHSTNDNQDNKTCFREGSLLHSVHLKGGFCI